MEMHVGQMFCYTVSYMMYEENYTVKYTVSLHHNAQMHLFAARNSVLIW